MTKKVKDLKIEIQQEGKGQDILLLHGWGGNIESLKGLQENLSEQGYRVTNISLPGFGNSEAPATAWSLKDFSLFLEELILELKLQKPIIIGHSFGGKIAMKLSLDHPNLISKLILINTSGIKQKNSLKKGISKSVSKLIGPLLPNSAKRLLYKYVLGETDYVNSGAMKATMAKIVEEHLDDKVANIEVETLIIWSSDDTYVPLWMGEKLNELIPNSSIKVIEGATHGLPLTDPKKVSKIINEWL